MVSSEKWNTDERGNVLVRGQAWDRRWNKMNSLVSSNLETVQTYNKKFEGMSQ